MGQNLITMTDAIQRPELPDHLSIEPFDVEEYCMSEGWVKVPAAKTRDRKGNPLMIKLKGKVEVFYK